ncbi:LysR family transcriptional regulator [Roseibium sp. M-1]
MFWSLLGTASPLLSPSSSRDARKPSTHLRTGATELLTKKPRQDGLPKQSSPKLGRSIEIRHLRFAAAAESHGSFRKAAQALGVKQSTLSRTISQMEARLGLTIFERTSGGARLTKAEVTGPNPVGCANFIS